MTNEQKVKSRIGNDLKDHVVTVLHADGLYRHWRCAKPGTSNASFEIVTWPGSLCYTGDMGDYLFQRVEDMVAFMRGSCMSYDYAAEKCVADDGRVTEFDDVIFEQELARVIADADRASFDDVEKKVDAIRSAYANNNSEHDALAAMFESCLWDELPTCRDYTYHFLWCLHAIKWFCERVE